jgi:YidC/Oxa1 family membrane protein insertase
MTPMAPQGADNTRNLILAMVLSMAILFGFEFFVTGPQRERLEAERAAIAAQEDAARKASAATPGSADPAEAGPVPPAAPVAPEQAIAAARRIVFDTPSIDGSINLEGARFDDLSLKQYHQTVERKTEVRLLAPQGAAGFHDAFFGWENAGTGDAIAGARTAWTAPDGASLSTDRPVTLTYADPSGLTIVRTISVDDRYVFTISDRIENTTEASIAVRPYATVRRLGLPEDFIPNQIVHQGMLGVFGPKLVLNEARYQKAEKHAREKLTGRKLADTRLLEAKGQGGWLGISDHYWLSALLPPQTETIEAWFDARPEDGDINYRAAFRGEPRAIPAGGVITYEQHFFAGAKRVDVLQDYGKTLNLPEFDKAVDWGFLWFLTRPFFWLLDLLGGWFGNFGLAILGATVVVKLLLFPLVNQSYEAMSKLKKLQPKMQEIQERFAADKQRQQQEMIKLYGTEKVNPLAGCLPILAQIPIFYALYKVLTVTIEMRHAPFFGWIQDLSAPDPTTIFNLFGLLPFDPTALPLIGSLLQVGVWPILYGITMWGVQSLSPPPPDPIQRQVFAILPWLFVFLFGGFAAGLVIYWTWSNLLSIAQQYLIMRKNGVETELDKLVGKLRRTPARPAE